MKHRSIKQTGLMVSLLGAFLLVAACNTKDMALDKAAQLNQEQPIEGGWCTVTVPSYISEWGYEVRPCDLSNPSAKVYADNQAFHVTEDRFDYQQYSAIAGSDAPMTGKWLVLTQGENTFERYTCTLQQNTADNSVVFENCPLLNEDDFPQLDKASFHYNSDTASLTGNYTAQETWQENKDLTVVYSFKADVSAAGVMNFTSYQRTVTAPQEFLDHFNGAPVTSSLGQNKTIHFVRIANTDKSLGALKRRSRTAAINNPDAAYTSKNVTDFYEQAKPSGNNLAADWGLQLYQNGNLLLEATAKLDGTHYDQGEYRGATSLLVGLDGNLAIEQYFLDFPTFIDIPSGLSEAFDEDRRGHNLLAFEQDNSLGVNVRFYYHDESITTPFWVPTDVYTNQDVNNWLRSNKPLADEPKLDALEELQIELNL